MRLRTPLTELIGIEHPVVQTGMGWVAGARLVSATANAGGLGILASATMTLDELAAAITKVKAVTDKPFGVNIRADAADAGDRVELMIREGVRVASFALAPKQQLIARLKEAGAVVIPSIGAAKLHHAHARPPKRHFASDPIGLVPWRSARGKDRGSASVLDRIDEYHRNGAAVLHPHIAGLTDSQDPYELFLTCADSRILPNVITASGPGDLYTVRNLGNLVPTDPDDRSVDAALDFAVNQLGVSSVVVCGHSSCAAMTALLEDDPANTTTPMMRWLENAHDSLVVFRNHHPARRSAESAGYPEADQLSIVNVAVQVERLTRHPILATAVAAADLQVIGIFFDISTARVYEVGPNGIICPDEPADRPVDHESAQ